MPDEREMQVLFPDNGSIEHILPESSSEMALNIGNLILLELKLNNGLIVLS